MTCLPPMVVRNMLARLTAHAARAVPACTRTHALRQSGGRVLIERHGPG